MFKKTHEFHINGYRLQYWLYAVLNCEFGSEVKFRRDSLHGRYEANRHSFDVRTNTQSIRKVRDTLVQKLLDAGYERDKEFNSSDSHFTKITYRKSGVEKLHVSVNEQTSGFNVTTPYLMVSAFAYWQLDKKKAA